MGVNNLSENRFDYLKLQYEEGARIIRYWIECRYKILQFVGYFNAAVLTLGFGQKILKFYLFIEPINFFMWF